MAIQSVRCDGVRRMPLAENCSIRQAAEACGFSNRAHFYRMYRRFVEHLLSMEAKA
ncbi:helix-turn-helix domain-containing protein [Eisenbergiella massiliensis]